MLTKISHDVNKEKGHVFSYERSRQEDLSVTSKAKSTAMSTPLGAHARLLLDGSSSSESIDVNSVPKGPTVFSVGAIGSSSTGTLRNKKKNRQRPPAWVRHVRPNRNVSSKDHIASDKTEGETGPSKRKAEEPESVNVNKSTKTKEDTVASGLRLLLPQ